MATFTGIRVCDDGADDGVAVSRVEFVTTAFDADERRAVHCFRQRDSVFERIHRICRLVSDEQRHAYFRQWAPLRDFAHQLAVIRRTQVYAGPVIVPLDE